MYVCISLEYEIGRVYNKVAISVNKCGWTGGLSQEWGLVRGGRLCFNLSDGVVEHV